MQRKNKKPKFNQQEWLSFGLIMGLILLLLLGAFGLGRLSAPRPKKAAYVKPPAPTTNSSFFIGETYSAVYQESSQKNNKSQIVHTLTVHFKTNGTLIQKDEQLDLIKDNQQNNNKITVYSGTTELNGNILQGKISSLVEASYKSSKNLKANRPYDVRARGEAFSYPLKDQDPTNFWFSLDGHALYEITTTGQVVKLVKSQQKVTSLPEYARIFGKQRDQNEQAASEKRENAANQQNELVPTQENSDGVYFNFGYFSNEAANQYTIDMQIANPTNKAQYVTLDQVIYASSLTTYQPNPNYRGQTTIPAFGSKYFPAFFQKLKYDDIFGQFQIYYHDATNPIIKHNRKEQFPINFSEGQLENSGI